MPEIFGKKERAKRLIELSKKLEIEYMNKFVGKTVEVLVEGPSKHDISKLTGRTRTGRLVNFTGEGINAGDIVNVKITRAQNFSLIGEVVK